MRMSLRDRHRTVNDPHAPIRTVEVQGVWLHDTTGVKAARVLFEVQRMSMRVTVVHVGSLLRRMREVPQSLAVPLPQKSTR